MLILLNLIRIQIHGGIPMFKFVLDLGTIFNIFLLIFYLVIAISFQFCKIGSLGLKNNVYLKSEKTWHKAHVAASFSTIPFIFISIILIFVNNMWLKIAIGLILILLLPIVLDIVGKLARRKESTNFKKEEKHELENQVKKESGWK